LEDRTGRTSASGTELRAAAIHPLLKAVMMEEGGRQRREKHKAGSKHSPQTCFASNIQTNSRAAFLQEREAWFKENIMNWLK
jgi:hypothetical protein